MTRVLLSVRYDDLSNGSPDEVDAGVCEAVARAGLSLTVGVIPVGNGPPQSRPAESAPPETRSGDGREALSARKADLLLPHVERGRIEVAQHGYDHRAMARVAGDRPSEFAGVEETVQRERIRRGADILADRLGVVPRTFIPPWNRLDASTLRALEAAGFRTVSAGLDAPDGETTLAVVPATTSPMSVRRTIGWARRRGGRHVMVVLLHPYDFVELGAPVATLSLERWGELAAWIADQPDVRCVPVGDLGELEPDLDLDRLRSLARYRTSRWRRVVPASWPGSMGRELETNPEPSRLARLGRERVLLALGSFGLVALGGAAAGRLTRAALAEAGSIPAFIALALAALLAVRSFRAGGPYFRGLAAVAGAAAFAVSAWWP